MSINRFKKLKHYVILNYKNTKNMLECNIDNKIKKNLNHLISKYNSRLFEE